jgi:hypothetical protein
MRFRGDLVIFKSEIGKGIIGIVLGSVVSKVFSLNGYRQKFKNIPIHLVSN